ncbi:alpha/beta-hydrolase, partial [Athelia psychrophila]
MDAAFYKQAVTSRDLKYNYYFAPAQPSKPTLLFLHGFPSTSYDWRHQVAFFQPRGYGIIVPDMLGYGGTDKPDAVDAYTPSLMAKDIVDVLDVEKVDKVISVSHDWGSRINSRLVNFHPERVTALAFLAVGYLPPFFDADTSKLLALTKQIFGYETSGYWSFFAEDGTDKIVESHWDSFHSIMFPADLALWQTTVGPTGELKAWL